MFRLRLSIHRLDRPSSACRRTRLVGTSAWLSFRPSSSSAPREPSRRVRKTTTTVKLADLPQGILHPPPLPPSDQDDAPAYPTVVLQARRTMRQFSNCVLLTRVGGFYELYFEHADQYAPLLNLKLAHKKTSAGPVPMAGFPFFQLDRFLKVLVQDLQRHVAIADEFPNDAADKIKSGGLMHHRKVTRVVTPGTLIDENFIDPYANNYVMAIHLLHEHPPAPAPQDESQPGVAVSSPPAPLPLGLAWLDLSTGQFFTQASDMLSLPSVLPRIGPREIVLDQELAAQKNHDLLSVLTEDRYMITYSPPSNLTHMADWTPFLEEEVPESKRSTFSRHEVLAGSLVLGYVRDRLQGMAMKLQPPQRYESMQIMKIDKNSLRALEIKQTIRDGHFRGSLLHAIRRTVTKGGARLLDQWLGSPSTSLSVITKRQDLTACFIANQHLRHLVLSLLRRTHDSQRLVQKFSLGRGDADDLLALADTIHAARDLVDLLAREAAEAGPSQRADCLSSLTCRVHLAQPLELAGRIKDSIDEEGIVQQHQMQDSEAGQILALAHDVVASQGSPEDASLLPKERRKRGLSIREHYAEDNEAWVMKPAASADLQTLHAELGSLNDERQALELQLRDRFATPSLSLRWTPGLGHIAHVKGKDTRSLSGINTLSSSRSTRTFHLPEWTALGQRLDQARFRIRREEQRVFQSLREQVVLNLVKLRRNAAVLDELDVAASFAQLALERDLVRPRLNQSTSHTIIGARHPTVEGGLREQGRSFVRNDCFVGSPSDGLLWLITGPNMAGKSTFLRQNALITILAQVGSYVPASFAELGIVDAIFSRVGSADNLYRDQSTFMVEMMETAQILRQATKQSFVIMDEIGRGTTPDEGTAVSFACLHHLVTVNQCRTLFATHFHRVADLAAAQGLCGADGAVRFYCTDVEEDDDGGFVYVHKLRNGINRESHALKVACLAGLPGHAINLAQRVLDDDAAAAAAKQVYSITGDADPAGGGESVVASAQ